MPIAVAPIGKEIRVVKVIADEKTKKHLADLGITVNATLTVLSSEGGTVIVSIKDGRLALDRTISTKILVA
ncbi:MAG: ferrous iron transport protein A [Clostridia bacterium]|nr:ferrous iron transport protein A [Clostridia bacterium]